MADQLPSVLANAFCSECGASVESNARFCKRCGTLTPLGETSTSLAVVDRPPPPPLPVNATPPVTLPVTPQWVQAPPAQPWGYAGGPTVIFQPQSRGPGLFIRALWFVFLGYWLAGLTLVLAYAILVLSLGLLFPVSFALFNRVPYLLTLRERTRHYVASTTGMIATYREQTIRQRPWYLRVPYFILVGWWLTLVWMTVAWAIAVFIITIPLTIWMLDRISGIATLQRH